MTTDELDSLYREHDLILARIFRGPTAQRTGQMSPADRAAYEADSRRFADLDRAIVAELRHHPHPVELPGATLWLTSDRLNFVALAPGTERPVWLTERQWRVSFRHQMVHLYGHDRPRAPRPRDAAAAARGGSR